MSVRVNRDRSRLVTSMRYRDVGSAIDWLSKAFGFSQMHKVSSGDGAVAFAQLIFANAMVMVVPVGFSGLEDFMKQPDEIGGTETQSCYFVIDDITSHYDKAKSAGAEIILELQAYEQGGAGYTCRDPEGHIWTFGTFDPWKIAVKKRPLSMLSISNVQTPTKIAGGIVAAAIISALAWHAPTLLGKKNEERETLSSQETAAKVAAESAARLAREELARAVSAKEAAERNADELKRKLTQGQAKDAAVAAEQRSRVQSGKEEETARLASQMQLELARERKARQSAEASMKEAQEILIRERTSRDDTEKASRNSDEQLLAERKLRTRAEQAEKKITKQLEAERVAREAAERAVAEARAQLQEQKRGGSGSGPIAAPTPVPAQRPPATRKSPDGPREAMPEIIP